MTARGIGNRASRTDGWTDSPGELALPESAIFRPIFGLSGRDISTKCPSEMKVRE